MKKIMTMKLLCRLCSLLLLLGGCLFAKAQQQDVFERVEGQCPELPRGLLHAISFTNTHCHHLTDADYTSASDDPEAMPRAYGMMGLVRDGKGCFRENLVTVAALSGCPEKMILEDPYTNVLAYAKAFLETAGRMGITGDKVEAYAPVIEALSELPRETNRDELPMKMMLYSVFELLDIDLHTFFGDDYETLSAKGLTFREGPDYAPALWVPAPECNYDERPRPVSGVVIHYTEGSYAGCISWFQNCESHVSSHYVIRSRDGQVTQMVREADRAWHARSANAYTIGIEHEAYGDIASFFTEAMYASSADLVRDICTRYEAIDGHRTFYTDTLDSGMTLNDGLWDLGGEDACVRIRGHQHYPGQSHTDPGPYWDWNYYYKKINEGDPVDHLGGAGALLGKLDHLDYGNNERKIWVITSDDHTSISLRFSDFKLEKDYDFLWIYDGDNVYAPKLGRWNTHSPGRVTSSSNAMCIEFRSDCEGTGSGWKAVWSVRDNTGVGEEQLGDMTVSQIGDDLFLQASDPGQYEVAVTDLCGRIVARRLFSGTVTIPLNRLAHGMYLLHYTRRADGLSAVRRIIH